MESTTTSVTPLPDIFNLFKPVALEQDQLKFYHETAAVRDGSRQEVYNQIFKTIVVTKSLERLLVIGHIGCGKSTELQMLQNKLSASEMPSVHINVLKDLDLFTFTYIDLLILIVEKLVDYAAKKEKILNKDMLNAFAKSLLNKVTIEYWAKDVTAKIDAAATIKAAAGYLLEFTGQIAAAFKMSSGTREELRGNFEPKVREIIDAINALVNAIHSQTASKFVIIIDGLEKCHQDKALKLFTQDIAFISEIKTHLVLACPITTYRSVDGRVLTGYFQTNFTMPMIKTHNKIDRTPFEDGVETIKNLILKRAEASSFEDGVLDIIIEKAGGNLRDTINILSQSAFEAYMRDRTTVDMDSTDFVLKKLAYDTFMRVPASSYERAKMIYKGDHRITQDKELADLLYTGAAFEYNGERWVDLAPLVRDYIDKNPGILGEDKNEDRNLV